MIRGKLLALLVSLGLWGGLTRVHNYNEAVRAATSAYSSGKFAEAAMWYERAQELGKAPEELRLNLGHAHARTGNAKQARQAYSSLLQSASGRMRSVARQQLASLAVTRGDNAQATALLRQALLDDPTNNGARYNYELLRQYQGQPAPPRIPPPAAPQKKSSQSNTDQPQPGSSGQGLPEPTAAPDAKGDAGQSNQNQQPGAGTPKNTPQGAQPGNTRGASSEPDDAQSPGQLPGLPPSAEGATAQDARVNTQRARLQQMNLTEAQARQVLDALRANEQQYLQQLPHRATQKPDPNKPRW
jgi:hypothetical protein